MNIEIIKGSEIGAKIKKEGITIVNIFGSWCGPCKMLTPILEEMKEDGVEVFKIDVDKNKEYAQEMKVAGVPTTWIYKDGEIKDTITGFIPKQVLEQKIELL